MKSSADRTSSTTSATPSRAPAQPYFAKAGGGTFFMPAARLSSSVQTKLEISKANDRFEVEADTMAGKVMRMPAPVVVPVNARDNQLQRLPSRGDAVLRKAGEAALVGGGDAHAAIRSQTAGGQPLSGDVRGFMEPRFNADFSAVRVHTDAESASLSNQLGARAFTYQNHVFFSRDQYQPGTSEGRQLLAHELTHTIQQGHAIQRSPQVSTTSTPPPVQRLGIQDALDYFADKAANIPGYTMLTLLIGFNPINMRSVSRTAANLLRALIELIPGGHVITQVLDNHGVINKAAAWLEQKISVLGDIGGSIVGGIKRFIDSLGWRDIFDLGDVWDRAKRIFTDPIDRLIDFGVSTAVEILKMVKDAILKPLAALAQGTRGYDLLKAILGEDPITGEPVPRTADTLIGGFMKLIGQDEIWENIKKGNAIARAWAWFQGALEGLMGLVRAVPHRIVDTLTSLTFTDIITVVGAFTKIASAFISIATDFIGWGLKQVLSLLEIIFSVVAPGVMPYIKKAQAAFATIIKNPIGFVNNLVRAGKRGFQLFADNIVKHLKDALIKWLVGPLGDAGVYIPTSFTLLEIVKLVLSVLGLTWQNIRGKLVKIIPEPVLVGLEKTAGVLVTLVRDGPAAAWEQIKSELSELKDQLISQVTDMITSEVVKAAVAKLVTMLNPAGAVIQAIIAIYNTVSFFIAKIQQIAAVVASFIDSISAIAAGQVDDAAKKVEQTMASTLVVVIGFLAKFAGLGNIPDKLVGIVKRIRQPIDKGLDRIVEWLGNLLKSAKEKVVSFLFPPKTFAVGAESHTLSAEDDEVMLASNKGRLAAALATFESSDPAPSVEVGKLIKKARALGVTLTGNLKKKDDSLADTNKTLRDEIIGLLVTIMYETGSRKKTAMSPVEVNFDSLGNKQEFKRQIDMQQAAINNMTIFEWTKNRARFVAFGRASRTGKEGDTDETRRLALATQIIQDYRKVAGLSPRNRNKLAKYADISTGRISVGDGEVLAQNIAQSMIRNGRSGQAVLHTVDQVAGGDFTTYGDESGVFGNSRINSSIGSQWKTKIAKVDEAAKNVNPQSKVNVVLKI